MPDRLNDLGKSVVINLQQRTHEDDATGTLIRHGQGYEFISIPMEFDPLRISRVVFRRDASGEPSQVWTDPRALGVDGELLPGLVTNARGEPRVLAGSAMARAEGSLCWPERFPPETVRALQAEKGQYAWDSQYNQIPGVRGGSIVRKDWWRLWDKEEYPDLGTVLVSLDTAVEEGTQNDYNACSVWGAFAGEEGEPLLLLLEAWRARLPLAELVDRVAGTCRRRKADYLLIEHRTRGRDVHDEICRLYQDASWMTVLVKVETSKVARLKAVEHLFSGDYRKDPSSGIESWDGGIVYAPDKDWASDVIDETASFPYGQHDDYVDTVSMALGWVRKEGVALRKVEYDFVEQERRRYRKPVGVPYAITRA
jgi:phage terminase large subunit-like protein